MPRSNEGETLASREVFIDMDSTGYWQRAKSGNFYARDYGHTYTLVREYDHDEEVWKHRAVVVGPGGARRDIEAQQTVDMVIEMLWPVGAERPISAR